MPITRLDIRNFRSILNARIDLRNVNIFVGQNDEGKSNVLRSLDLFFNGTRRNGYELIWDDDYSAFAEAAKGRAREISVQLTLELPRSFADRRPVLWRKTWRREGLHAERISFADGTTFGARSKIGAFLAGMRFDYVPAIKSPDYFASLMAKLHDMLESTVEEQIRTASKTFTKTINANTSRLLADIVSEIGLDASIELPTDLRDVFSRLEFRSGQGEMTFSLRQRGDGIKVRHIPIVLRWLAEQANHLSAPGKPRVVTIWGYEEPENNLELQRCFEVAKDFVNNSDETQVFVTTHSPAIYSVAREDLTGAVSLFYVRKQDGTTLIERIENETFPAIDGSMGLLALLEPHMRSAQQEVANLSGRLASLPDPTMPTIFVEGPSDKVILEKALQVLDPAAAAQIRVRCSTANGGGHAWVADQLIAWSHHRPEAVAIGLFDADADAKKSREVVRVKLKGGVANVNAIPIELKPSDHVIQCIKAGFLIPYAIEELLPVEVWAHAQQKGWLVDRERLPRLYNFDRADVSFDEFLSEKLPSEELQRYVRRKVRAESKEAFSRYVASIDAEAVWFCLKRTVEDIVSKLRLTVT